MLKKGNDYYLRATILILIALGSFNLALGQTRVHIYIRAFIPKDHPGNPGYFRPIPGNWFAVPNPHLGPSTNFPFTCQPSDPTDDVCFSTDKRGFSSDITVTSRALTEFVLVISGNTVSLEKASGRELQRVDVTHKLSCQTGIDLVPPQAASTSTMVLGTPAIADGIAQIVVDGRAINPLAPVLEILRPGVKYSGTFTFNTKDNSLRFQGSTKIFPAYEAYAQLNDGPIATIFTTSPDQNSTACDLLDLGSGVKLKSIDKTITLQDNLDGRWETSDADHRFLLEITGTNVQWTERGTPNTTPGATFMRPATATFSGGKFRIERPNDNAALTFLGYQPQSLRDAIMSRNPQPSFIVFTKTGNTLTAEWNGLVVTKNPNGTLKDVIQPGIRPPKSFTFNKLP